MQRQKETDSGKYAVYNRYLIVLMSAHVCAVIQYTWPAHLAHSIALTLLPIVYVSLSQRADLVFGVT